MSNSARLKPLLAIALASIIWGAASPIFKWSLTNIPPFTLAFLRFSLAALILYPFLQKKFYPLEKRDFTQVFLFGFSGITLNISAFFLGLRLAPSINASIIGTIQPLILLTLGAFYLKEKVEKMEIAGTLISLIGILIIILSPFLTDSQAAEISFLGNLFFILAMLGAVGQTIVGKKLFNKYPDPLPITFYAFIVGAFSFFPLFIIEYLKNPGWLGNLDLAGGFGIFYGVVFSSLLAYVFYDYGLSKIEASETGVFNYLMPITAVLIAVPFFGEKLTIPFILGCILVILGIFLTERHSPFHPLYKDKKN